MFVEDGMIIGRISDMIGSKEAIMKACCDDELLCEWRWVVDGVGKCRDEETKLSLTENQVLCSVFRLVRQTADIVNYSLREHSDW